MTARSYACIRDGFVDNVIVLDDEYPHDPSYVEHMAAVWDSIVPAESLPGHIEPGAAKVGGAWVGLADPSHPRYVAPEPPAIDRVTDALKAHGLSPALVTKALAAIEEVYGGG